MQQKIKVTLEVYSSPRSYMDCLKRTSNNSLKSTAEH